MKTYFLKAPAKVNFFLEIKNRKSNGYHNLESIMQTISLYDILSFELTKEGIFFECNDKYLQNNKTNIVYKAALAIKNHFNIKSGIKIYLKKVIPVGAGLGGGSSDAALTLKALVKLWNIKTTIYELEQIAVKLGADVPFFLTGGTALCEGIGENVTPLKSINNLNIILVNPGFSIFTANVYKKVKLPLTKQIKIHTIKSLICNDFFNIRSAFNNCFNRLEEFVFPEYPEIVKIKKFLNGLGCVSLMSGSGPTVFGIFDFHITRFKSAESEFRKNNWKTWFVATIQNNHIF
jgi:4-diphosphocytidyl-2-C-methyl-D-erythritol kinase